MRILAIRGQALASLVEPFELLLDRGPLEQIGLFSICGPTGAGKSTILDAMCLALFGETPRLQGRSKSKIGRVAQGKDDYRLSDKDPRALLSRGRGQAFAEVEFLGVDNQRYRSRWSVRRSRLSATGRVQKASLELFRMSDGSSMSDGRASRTQVEIQERLGLSFEQFCRSVLLAQGDFAAFLRADDKERADLLERMTGTEIYRQLSVACHQRNREEQQSVSQAQQKMQGLEIWDDAQAKARRCAQQEAQQAQEKALRALEARRVLRDAALRRRDLVEALKAAQAQRTQAQSKWEDSQKDRRRLDSIDEVEPLRAPCEQLDTHRRKIEELRSQILKAQQDKMALEGQLQASSAAHANAQSLLEQKQAQAEGQKAKVEQAKILDVQMRDLVKLRQEAAESHEKALCEQRKLQSSLLELSRRVEETRQARAQHQERWPDLERAQHLHARGDELLAVLDTLRELAPQRDRQQEKIAAETARLQALQEAGQARAKQAKALEDRQGQLLDLQGGEALGERIALLSADLAQVERARLHQDALQGQLGALVEGRLAARELATQRQKLQEEHRGLSEQLEALRREKQCLDSRLLEANTMREQAQRMRAMAQYRDHLVQGEACPLCGSQEHQLDAVAQDPARDAFDLACVRIEELERALLELQSNLDKKNKESIVLGTTLAGLPERERSLDLANENATKDLEEREKQLQECLQALKCDLATQMRVPETTIPGSLEDCLERCALRGRALQALAVKIEEQKKQDQEKHRRALQMQEELRRLRASLDELRGQETSSAPDLARASSELARLTSEHKGLMAKAKELKERLREMWKGVQGPWRTPPSQLSELRAAVLQWLREAKAAGAQATALQELGVKLDREEHSQKETLKLGARRVQDSATELQTREESFTKQNELRRELLGGRSVEAFLEGQARALESAANALHKAKEAQESARRACLAQGTRIEGLVEQHTGLTRDFDELQAAFVLRLEELQLEQKVVRELLELPTEGVKALRESLQACYKALEAAQTRLESRTQDLARHQEQYPELEALEHAQARFEQANAESNSRQKALLELEHAIKENEARKTQRARLQDEHQAQLALARRWAKLNDLIGHSDGHRFQRFAQGLSLERLLALANRHLQDIDRRYRLERVQGTTLDLQVVDTLMGDEIRSVHSLSGGESFLVSLALALGLSSLSAMHTRVESLFIDEGFGTLDRDSLEQVLAALDALQASGRQVGVISHVDGLAEQLGARVQVQRSGHGTSQVKILAGSGSSERVF